MALNTSDSDTDDRRVPFPGWTVELFAHRSRKKGPYHFYLIELREIGTRTLDWFQVGISMPETPSDPKFAPEIVHAAFFIRNSSSEVVQDALELYHVASLDDRDKMGIKQTLSPGHKDVTWFVDESPPRSVLAILLRTNSRLALPEIMTNIRYHTGSKGASSSISHRVTFQGYSRAPLAVIWAATHGWTDVLAYMDSMSGKIAEKVDELGRTALSWAAGNGHIRSTEFLLEKASSTINTVDEKGRSPLSWAAGNGHIETLQLLRAYGAVWQLDKEGKSELWWAAVSGNGVIFEQIPEVPELTQEINDFSAGKDLDFANIGHSSPILVAARDDLVIPLRILVGKALQPDRTNRPLNSPEAILGFWLRKAAYEGWENLLDILIASKEVTAPFTEYKDPLCISVERGWSRLVEMLLNAGADVNSKPLDGTGDTALCLGIKNDHEDVVRLLLNYGANINLPDGLGTTPLALSTHRVNQNILAMINEKDEEGRLAKDLEHLDTRVDKQYTATIGLFRFRNHGLRFQFSERSVDKLWEDPLWLTPSTDGSHFQWIHLPANNMRWVELLFVKLYRNPAKAYQILAPERWVGRQHRGATEKPHARFMRPQCQKFSKTEDQSPLPNIVLFVPYLHWDINRIREARQKAVEAQEEALSIQGEKLLPDIELIRTYSKDPHHSLHIRRTLHQYYYHTLSNTEVQDSLQVTSRYHQREEKTEANVITMVDQLWLWVIRSSDEHPDVVISSFPKVSDTILSNVHPDQYGRTDVLENIKRHLFTNPQSVKGAYDLAGLIAAKCSRTYLDPATTLDPSGYCKGIQFSEIFEDVIGEIMQMETAAFIEFRTLSEGPHAQNMLGEIKTEIHWLSTIKNVIDELNIMTVLFETQQKRFQELDGIIHNKWMLNQVSLSIEEIRGLTERADRAHKSLNFLVDLKLKHNTVVESRKALKLTAETTYLTQSINQSTAQTRISVEQTTALAEKANKEGSTILVFTIVTIIFLPLSFMATMFQIDIRQYKRVDDQLDLGYVSAIIFPISTFISALLIWAAFKAAYVEQKLSRIFGRGKSHSVNPAIATSVAPSTLGIASV